MGLPEVGAPAPAIEVAEWISDMPSGGANLAGRTVVLEFWGTSCGPCVSAIPHLNDLIDRFGNQGIQFISLSHDAPELVARFMEKRPIKGAVAIDRDGRTFDAYGIRSIPHTVLIDSHGILRWQGHPNLFDEALLSRFLESDEVPAVDPPSASPEVVPIAGPPPMFSFTINQNASGPGGSGHGNDGDGWRTELTGFHVTDAIRHLLDISPLRVRVEGNAPTGLWDIEMRSTPPLQAAAARERTVELLCGIFGIEFSRELEQREGWKLTCPHSGPEDMSELDGGASTRCSQQELSAANITLDRLIKILEPALGVLLLDDTHLQGKYDVSIPVTSVEAARETLKGEYDIVLEPAAWEVETVVLGCAGGP